VSISFNETADFVPNAETLSRPSLDSLSSTRSALKRLIDIAAAAAILLAVTPLLLAIAALILLRDGRPIVYRHRRLGQGGAGFDCLKFRTMVRDADAALAAHLAADPAARAEWESSQKLRDDPRILGAIGRLLRRSSLDELPQLWNVLRGEMSLVGPRPIVADELVHYGRRAKWYFATRPGLTGPWQVSGRSDTSYATRVRLDVHYAQNLSLWRDLGILLRTVGVVLGNKGAY
jgi:exopolysaccharide production protein ExoY